MRTLHSNGTVPSGEERLEEACHGLMPESAAFNIEARRNVTFCDKPGAMILAGRGAILELR
jgi:hypothetical protein